MTDGNRDATQWNDILVGLCATDPGLMMLSYFPESMLAILLFESLFHPIKCFWFSSDFSLPDYLQVLLKNTFFSSKVAFFFFTNVSFFTPNHLVKARWRMHPKFYKVQTFFFLALDFETL